MKKFETTEYEAFIKESDGTFKPFSKSRSRSVKMVEVRIADHNELAQQHPTIWKPVTEYEIRKRTVTTTYTDWEKVD